MYSDRILMARAAACLRRGELMVSLRAVTAISDVSACLPVIYIGGVGQVQGHQYLVSSSRVFEEHNPIYIM